MNIKDAVLALGEYASENAYKGYDPYDALLSPLFSLPFFSKNKLIRFGTQQFVKRFPLNIRPLLLVPKGLNPVSLGLFIQGYANLITVMPGRKQEFIEKIEQLTDMLNELLPEGYSGACWGYDFDWEARHAKIPAYQPTVVATGIITNGLYQAWKITGLEVLKELVVDASAFVLKDLNRSYSGDTFCFSYSPFDEQRVFNASMKGARLLAQAFALTGDKEYKEQATQAVEYVAGQQRENGSWGYSLAKTGGWVDNYHTGYILDCLDEYVRLCDDSTYRPHLEKGFAYYRDHFFEPDGQPAFYSNSLYPADCTAASQSILTLTRFDDIDLARKVAEWTITNMQASDGHFYFRKFKYYTIKTSFMRWSDAWMFAALTYLIKYNRNYSAK
jgi:hypothetical protein